MDWKSVLGLLVFAFWFIVPLVLESHADKEEQKRVKELQRNNGQAK